MAEGGDHSSMPGCRCVQCIQNRTDERFYNSAQSDTSISSDNVDSRCEMPSQTLDSIVNTEQNQSKSDSSYSTSTTESLNNMIPSNDLTWLDQSSVMVSNGSTLPMQSSSLQSAIPSSSNAQHDIISVSPVDTQQTSLTMSIVQSDVSQDSTSYTNETASSPGTSSSGNQAVEVPKTVYSQILSDFYNYSGRFGLIHYRQVNSEVDDDSDSSSEDSTSDDESSDPNIKLCPLNDTDGCEDDCPYLHGDRKKVVKN
uniref:C3H1-type domain-containing protein n=1 Tax=Biomphalaria glabrata TaxID=6526 RepID=A0A2C9KFY8_BIOGL